MDRTEKEALDAFLAVLAVEESLVSEAVKVKFSVWKWLTMFDSKVCDRCDVYKGDEYELDDPRDLELMFPYGYFIDDYTFAPMIHPNDRCRIERVRDYDEDMVLINRRKQSL